MAYVDGFVMPVPKRNFAAYRRLAKAAGRIWMDHGALGYVEAVGEDVKTGFGVPFTKLAKLKAGETVLFSFIRYRSRAHRDRVNARVMKDPRMQKMMARGMPFDTRRMSMGGFQAFVDL
jgi:uncharacterized protein YbaA (DUF1428 family)